MEPIRILVVEDHHVVRQGLVALLRTGPDMLVVAEASDGRQAVADAQGGTLPINYSTRAGSLLGLATARPRSPVCII